MLQHPEAVKSCTAGILVCAETFPNLYPDLR